MDFRILGPLEASEDGVVVGIQGAKPRALLAVLVLRANEVVSTDELIDALWGERPPETAQKIVQTYVSQLRKALHRNGRELLLTRPRGYELQVEPSSVDLTHFEELAAAGRAELAAGRPAPAAALFREALALWRGAPLAEFRGDPFAQRELRRLEEARLAALEDRIDADLRSGAGGELVPELEALVAAEPLREHPRGQLMLALYRAGRQADALSAYRDARRTLHEELGLDPAPELQALEKAILTQDESLAPPRVEPAAAEPGRRRHAGLLLVALAVAGAAVAAALLLAGGGGTHVFAVAPNSLAVIDPASNAVASVLPTGVGPRAVVVARGDLWIANATDRTLSRFDGLSLKLRATIPLGTDPGSLAAGLDAIWVVGADYGDLVRISIGSDGVSRPVQILNGCGGPRTSVTTGAGSVWAACDVAADAVRVNPDTLYALPFAYRAGLLTSTVSTTAPHFAALLFGNGVLWIADRGRGLAIEIDPRTNLPVRQVPVGRDPVALAEGFGSLWIAGGTERDLLRLVTGPSGSERVQAIPLGRRALAVAAGSGAVWVACADGTIVRVDPKRDLVVATVRLSRPATALATGLGRVFATVSG